MPDLFVDIETAPDMTHDEYLSTKQEIESGTLTWESDKARFWKFEKGGLRPFDGKVILITYQVNNAHIHRLVEWNDGEESILRRFYYLLKDLHQGSWKDRLKIIGHNILGFDLFFLYNRLRMHEIEEEKWIYQTLINKPEVVDFLQIHLPLNNYDAKGLKHDVLAHAYGLPVKDTLGSEEIQHYFQKKYDMILKYSEREFVYPELYQKIRSDGLVSRQRLQESIKWYNDLHASL